MKKMIGLFLFCLGFGIVPIFFPSYAEENLSLNLTNKNLNSIQDLQEYNFENYNLVNLSNNEFDDNDWVDLKNLANSFTSTTFILVFNNVSNATDIPANILLGVQNLNSVYLNNFDTNSYKVYSDINNYKLSIQLVERLDNKTSFCDETTVSQAGKYNLILSNETQTYSKSFVFGNVETTENAECEFEENFYDKFLTFSEGLEPSDFYIEILNKDGTIFSANKVGTYDIVYNIYLKSGNNEKTGKILTSLSQKLTLTDTTGPVITPNENYSYVYIFGQYQDSGATAMDAVCGKCDVFCFNNINTSQIGKYDFVYVASDKYGNTTKFTKTVEVIYHPIQNISLKYDKSNTYSFNQKIDFEIVVNDGNQTYFTNPNRVFYIYNNNKLLIATTSQKFSLNCDEYGTHNLTITTQDILSNGSVQTVKSSAEIVVMETNWWKNPIIIIVTIGTAVLIYFAGFLTSWVYKKKEKKNG